MAALVAQGKCHYYDLPELRLRDLRSLLLFRKKRSENMVIPTTPPPVC